MSAAAAGAWVSSSMWPASKMCASIRGRSCIHERTSARSKKASCRPRAALGKPWRSRAAGPDASLAVRKDSSVPPDGVQSSSGRRPHVRTPLTPSSDLARTTPLGRGSVGRQGRRTAPLAGCQESRRLPSPLPALPEAFGAPAPNDPPHRPQLRPAVRPGRIQVEDEEGEVPLRRPLPRHVGRRPAMEKLGRNLKGRRRRNAVRAGCAEHQ